MTDWNPRTQNTPPPPPTPAFGPPPYYAPPPPVPPAKPRKQWPVAVKVLIAVVGILAVLTVIGVAASSHGQFAPATTHTVEYQVTGASTAGGGSITMETPTGVEQDSVDIPMMRADGSPVTFTDFKPGEYVYISVQNQGGGTITCHILVDGTPISENTASGDYMIATCQGSVPN